MRQTGLCDEEILKHVNWLAERQSKLAYERRSAKVNRCEVENLETKPPSLGDNSKILAEIRAINLICRA